VFDLSLPLFLINAIVSSGSVKLVLEPSIQSLPATFTQYRIECPYHGEYDKRLEPDGRELESVFKSDFSIDEVAPWQSLLLLEFSLSSIRSLYSLLRLLRALARLWPSRFGRLCLRKSLQNMTLKNKWVDTLVDPNMTIFSETEPPKSAGP
jgi:hypothetical protein